MSAPEAMEQLIESHIEVSSQKRRVISNIEVLWLGLYRTQAIDLDASPAPSGLLGKRPRTSAGGGSLSQQQLPPELARSFRIEDIWRTCSIILLKKLWASKSAPPFLQPVDPMQLNILDYYNYVQVKRLQPDTQHAQRYASIMHLAHAASLMHSSCIHAFPMCSAPLSCVPSMHPSDPPCTHHSHVHPPIMRAAPHGPAHRQGATCGHAVSDPTGLPGRCAAGACDPLGGLG